MKYLAKFISNLSFICFSVLSLFTACSRDADNLLPEVQNLSINTAVQSYVLDDGITRATISGLTTTFVNGDEIGLFAIKNGSLLYNNIKLTYQGSGAWSAATTVYNYGSGITYYAYHPYRADIAGKTSIDAIKSAFPVQASQITDADFKASNLLTATGSLSGNTVNLSFTPAFSMVDVVSPKAGVKGYSNAASENFTYSIYGGDELQNFPAGYVSDVSSSDRSCRIIVKPGTAFSIKVNTKGSGVVFNKSITPVAGQYKKLVLDGTVNRNLAVGDYVYGGGGGQLSFFPGTKDPISITECIGIVFSVGANKRDGEAHGMVVARQDACGYDYWAVAKRTANEYKPTAPSGSGWYFSGIGVMQFLISGGASGAGFARSLEKYLTKIEGQGFDSKNYWSSTWAQKMGGYNYYKGVKAGSGETYIDNERSGYGYARAVFKF